MCEGTFKRVENEMTRTGGCNKQALAVVGEFEFRPVATSFEAVETLFVLFEIKDCKWWAVILADVVEKNGLSGGLGDCYHTR